jgi:gamma-glutamylcyclotransferase (GGCT)/AIG2-like uncharacterized protein YtfP
MRKVNKQSEGYQTRAQKKKERKELRRKSQMEKKILIGIYDDYRHEGCLNGILNKISCKLIGAYSTEPIYIMYDLNDEGLNCAVQINGNNSIKVEVWEVNEIFLDRIERSYNYYSDFDEYLQDYIKEKTLSPFGEISMYFINEIKPEDKIVISGDWIEYLNYKKVMGNKSLTL